MDMILILNLLNLVFPQGTVLGPLTFLMYINDIKSRISSNLRLFADDCIYYQVVGCDQDHNSLQSDLDLATR